MDILHLRDPVNPFYSIVKLPFILFISRLLEDEQHFKLGGIDGSKI